MFMLAIDYRYQSNLDQRRLALSGHGPSVLSPTFESDCSQHMPQRCGTRSQNGRTSNAFFEATKCSLPSTVEPTKATASGMHMTEPEHQVIDSSKRIQIRSEASLTPARKLSGVFRRGRPEASGPPRERPACRVRCARHGPGLRSVSKQAAGRRHRQGHGSLSSGRPASDPCNRIDRLFLALAACRCRRIEDHSII